MNRLILIAIPALLLSSMHSGAQTRRIAYRSHSGTDVALPVASDNDSYGLPMNYRAKNDTSRQETAKPSPKNQQQPKATKPVRKAPRKK